MRNGSIIQENSLPRSYSSAKIKELLEGSGSEKARWDACYFRFIKDAYFINASNQSSSGDFFGDALQPLFLGYYEKLSRFLSPCHIPRREKEELSKALDEPMRCILVLMALGLTPREGASKKIDSHILTMTINSDKGRALAVPAFAANDLRHAVNKELQKISQRSLARYPYELLRASIYFEIQRIESYSRNSDDPAARKSAELRRIMHSSDRCFSPGTSSESNYNLLASSALLPGKDLYQELNRQRPAYGVGLFWNRLFRLAQTRSLANILNVRQRIDAALKLAASPTASIRLGN